MNNEEIELESSLFTNMRYSKRPNTGKILSKYLQHKAKQYIESTFCHNSINSAHILKENPAQKPLPATKNQLKATIYDILIEKGTEYSTNTVLMATQICQIGQMSYQSAVKCSKKVIEWLLDKEPDN
ncbi:45956_t:CDS:2 [Gigaspora margarita]|uniref:45956_t:CDS:1 n=1 Tax=Gigaspora margarita TaxID=4874 RepID=A0ABN7VJC9_GIGMA|nr:45956_t:CDS:2 [Gigaspora margarita]